MRVFSLGLDCSGVWPGKPIVAGTGVVHAVFSVLFLMVLREQSYNQTGRGSVDKALCVNQHPVALITHEHFCCNRQCLGKRRGARG